MKRFVTTALALAAAGSAANAAGTSDSEWLELDSEINRLASSLTPAKDGMGWSALIRATFDYSTDDLFVDARGDDVDGFLFKDIDFAVWGSQGNYGWRISTDVDEPEGFVSGAGDSFVIFEDAHVWWNCGEYLTLTMGRQKPHLLRSGYIDPERTVFIDRTALGSSLDMWDNGIQASGLYDAFGWWFGVFNGFDADTVDHLYAARVEWNLGAGAGMGEGALGGNDDVNATIGLSYKDDDSLDGFSESKAWFVDVAGSAGPLGFGAEYGDLDDDEFLIPVEDFLAEIQNASDFFGFGGDTNPWDVWASWLLTPEWELAVRYEDMDNADFFGGTGPDNTLISVGVNYYQAAHNAKWQVQWTDVSADSGFDDGSLIQVGLTVGMTR